MVARDRKSFLDFEPISFSLTDGTNIPPPQESPPPTSGKDKINGAQEHSEVNGTDTETSATVQQPDHNATSMPPPKAPSIMSRSSRPHGGVRRLFSMSSLRSSFNGSRTSLALPGDTFDQSHDENRPGLMGNNSYPSADPPRPQSRAMSIRSTRWFGKRKSGLFTLNGDSGLASIGEDGRPESKKMRDSSPPPTLPEVSTLSGGLSDGNVGWDEQLFRKQ